MRGGESGPKVRGERRPPIASGGTQVLDGTTMPGRAMARPNLMEANVLLRPLPPFRAKPARRPLTPKRLGVDVEKEKPSVSIKARRHPVKVARLATAPSLKVLRADAYA